MFFCFKQKTAYEISRDWSSDVCSSDLLLLVPGGWQLPEVAERVVGALVQVHEEPHRPGGGAQRLLVPQDDGAAIPHGRGPGPARSEERRVGKASRWTALKQPSTSETID